MSRRRRRTPIVKSADQERTETPHEVVSDQLEALAREGAGEMLMTTLADEVDAYLGRGRYQRGGGLGGYRNGSSLRRLTLGSGTVALDTPRGAVGRFRRVRDQIRDRIDSFLHRRTDRTATSDGS